MPRHEVLICEARGALKRGHVEERTAQGCWEIHVAGIHQYTHDGQRRHEENGEKTTKFIVVKYITPPTLDEKQIKQRTVDAGQEHKECCHPLYFLGVKPRNAIGMR